MGKMREAIAVIGEGITEKYYIDSIRDCVELKPTFFRPTNSGIKELENTINKCIGLGYSKVFCLIDMDNKTNDGNAEHITNNRKYLELRRKFHGKVRQCKGMGTAAFVEMLESYPCTEVFFLYYSKYTTGRQTNEGLKSALKEMFGYSTKETYLMRNPLHGKLSENGSLSQAIENSKRSMHERCSENAHCTYTEIGKLFDELKLK